jgi:hypothetical protein
MKKKESELIIKAVLAGVADKYAIHDIDSGKQLRNFGIDNAQTKQIKERLLQALSGEESAPDPERFHAALKIMPTSTVAEVAAQLSNAYMESQPAKEVTSKPFEFKGLGKGDVEIAVRTELAQHSKKYSVLQIKPEMDLNDLGLDRAGIAKATTGIYKAFSNPNKRIKSSYSALIFPAKKSSKVEDLVQWTMSLSGDDTTPPRG